MKESHLKEIKEMEAFFDLELTHEKLNMAKDYLKKISKCEGQAWVRLDESVKMTVQFYAKEGLEQIGRIKD